MLRLHCPSPTSNRNPTGKPWSRKPLIGVCYIMLCCVASYDIVLCCVMYMSIHVYHIYVHIYIYTWICMCVYIIYYIYIFMYIYIYHLLCIIILRQIECGRCQKKKQNNTLKLGISLKLLGWFPQALRHGFGTQAWLTTWDRENIPWRHHRDFWKLYLEGKP